MTKKIIVFINKAIKKEKSREWTLKKLRDIIQDIPDFNIREKARLYVAAKRIAVLMYMQGGYISNSQIKKMSASWNKINEHCNSRGRKKDVKLMLQDSRAKKQVFFLCSSHSNPAEDHKDWQGKIYVDRFWRNTLGDDAELVYAVQSYIKNHDVKTVQWVMQAPVYMITRPYCRHKMIPMALEEVLHSSLKKIKANHPEAYIIEKKGDYKKKFYTLRYQIHKELGMDGEARRDKILIRRNSTDNE